MWGQANARKPSMASREIKKKAEEFLGRPRTTLLLPFVLTDALQSWGFQSLRGVEHAVSRVLQVFCVSIGLLVLVCRF